MKWWRISAGFVTVAGSLVLRLFPVVTGFDQHSNSKSADRENSTFLWCDHSPSNCRQWIFRTLTWQLGQLTEDIPDMAPIFMEEFWPGLLTLVLQARSTLSPILIGGQKTIGVRQPNDSRVCQLLKRIGPLTGTSANQTGQPPAQSAADVIQQLGSAVDVIVDGGSTPGGQPSTVLQILPEPRILRQGAISREQLQEILSADGFQFSEEQPK